MWPVNGVVADGRKLHNEVAITMRAQKTDGDVETAWLTGRAGTLFHDDDLFYKGVMNAAMIGEVAVPLGQRVLTGVFRESGSNIGNILFVCRPD